MLTDGLVYGSIVRRPRGWPAAGMMCGAPFALPRRMMVLLLSYGFFASVRQLMNATHTALAGVAAAEKVSNLLDIDTTRPVYDPNLPQEDTTAVQRHPRWSISPTDIPGGISRAAMM